MKLVSRKQHFSTSDYSSLFTRFQTSETYLTFKVFLPFWWETQYMQWKRSKYTSVVCWIFLIYIYLIILRKLYFFIFFSVWLLYPFARSILHRESRSIGLYLKEMWRMKLCVSEVNCDKQEACDCYQPCGFSCES